MARSSSAGGIALGTTLLLALTAGAVRAEAEEVEAYASVAELTTAADAVIVGQVVAAAPGRIVSGCGYSAATVRIDEVLAGATAPLAPTLVLEYFGGCGPDLPQLGNGIPAQRALFFLRNKGVELGRLRPDATPAEIGAESGFWRLAIGAATVVDAGGRIHVPDSTNAPFLAALEGQPFVGLVDAVRSAPGPRVDGAAAAVGDPTPGPWIVAGLVAGLVALLVVAAARRSDRAIGP